MENQTINWGEFLGDIVGGIGNNFEAKGAAANANVAAQNAETALAEKSFDHAAEMQRASMKFRQNVTFGILALVVVVIAAMAFVKTKK